MNRFSELEIDLRQMILALETAIDLVGMNDTNHGKRVGYIASQLAHRLGFSKQAVSFAFELGLLHDCGVSTEQMHSELVNQFDWEDCNIHCEVGYRLLKDFAPLEKLATPIRYHHTPWEELQNLNIHPQDALMANLIFLSDRVDILAARHYESDILLAKKEVVRTIQSYRGSYFDPAIVDAFLEMEKLEAFWISLEDRHVTRFTWDMGQFESEQLLSMNQLRQLSLIMSYIVDQKSPFTAQHSVQVAALSRHIASLYGLFDEQCDKIEIAGLLHDIGKLHMPDNILEKPGPLNDIERSIINQHSYETYEILRHIKGMEEIAQWAAYHHEGVNGTGYPFHPDVAELSIEARIIAVSDVFQALVQDRPYRKGMMLDSVITILDEFVEQGKLDKSIVELVKKHPESCYKVAKGTMIDGADIAMPFLTVEDFATQ